MGLRCWKKQASTTRLCVCAFVCLCVSLCARAGEKGAKGSCSSLSDSLLPLLPQALHAAPVI